MTRSKKIALDKFVMHEKQHLAALRPIENILCLETMRFAAEIVPIENIGDVPDQAKIAERELKAAQQLIDSLTSTFDPAKYADEYRDCIMSLVERKSRGEEIHIQPATPAKTGRAADLMSALEASLAATRKRNNGAAHPGHATRRRKSA